MKKLIITFLIVFSILVCFARDWLTIYNEDLALVRTQMELSLNKGEQFYNFDQITSRINPASVIISSLGEPFIVAEQNFEYDLAGTEQILKKYLEQNITVIAENQEVYTGRMKFFDGENVGLIELGTNKLILISRSQIQQLQLQELPSNFYTKPTLRWKLRTDKQGKFPLQVSYQTGGLSWDVTYNATWTGTELKLNSWVTINNNSGKGFDNVTLKLIAGEISQVRRQISRYMRKGGMEEMMEADAMAAPEFEEKAFHDFHMYTLSEPVSFADKQIKQLQLFTPKNVKAKQLYEYTTYATGVMSKIQFKNTQENGLGIPLPKGIVKFYKEDTDKNLEFIGEDEINHTSKNEEVKLTTGKAFDLVAKTMVKNYRELGQRKYENDMQITLRNNSNETKTIKVVHNRRPNSVIATSNVKYITTDDNKYVFEIEIKPNAEFVLTFTERFGS